jgi:hypothetical protein
MKKIHTLVALAILAVMGTAQAQGDQRGPGPGFGGRGDDRRGDYERERQAHKDDSFRIEGRWAERQNPRFHRHENLKRGHEHRGGRFPHHHHGDVLHTERQWLLEHPQRDDRRDGPGRGPGRHP